MLKYADLQALICRASVGMVLQIHFAEIDCDRSRDETAVAMLVAVGYDVRIGVPCLTPIPVEEVADVDTGRDALFPKIAADAEVDGGAVLFLAKKREGGRSVCGRHIHPHSFGNLGPAVEA